MSLPPLRQGSAQFPEMHVLMLTGDLAATAGGPPQVMFETARALGRMGIRITLMALGTAAPTTADPAFGDLPITIERFARDGIARLHKSRAMRRAIARRIADFDVLHVHGVWEGCLGDAAAIFERAGKPVFVSAHGMLDPWSLRQSRWRKRLALKLLGTGRMLARARAIVFATEEESANARHPGATRHAIVPNGLDLDALAPAIGGDAAPLLNRVAFLAQPGRTILYFSRIHPKKGLDLLAAAFCGVAASYPDVRLLILGIPQDADYQAKIAARIEAAGLTSRVGFITDLYGKTAKPALRHASLFALPSHQEGFSIALLEALGAGLPVLITDQCHLPEVAAWDAGRVVPDDAAGIARGLAELLALDEAQLAEMGTRGRKGVSRHFSLDHVADLLAALYRDGCVRESAS